MEDRTKEDKIRAEFEKEFPIPKELFWDKENETYNTNSDFQMMNEFIHTFIGFEYGYKAGAHSKQEKIETRTARNCRLVEECIELKKIIEANDAI